MKHKFTWVVLLIMAAAIIFPLIAAEPVMADKLSDAIAAVPQGTGKGQIDPAAAKGFLGIPGGPSPGLLICFLWAVWVGWIFSTVGAFGGIMAGVGHITIFGLGAYAKTFKETSPGLNKMMTDSIRVSNQWLV
ncbi:MAG: sulfite exporter TauE/SafE family protein, partial [Proteobacteria bacterium]|nr:sulfite exporter TauE/SafE family protein [Pseudomonadota bacterium]